MCLQEGPEHSEKIIDEEGRVMKFVLYTPHRKSVFPKVHGTPGHRIHETTKYAPYELVYGSHANLPLSRKQIQRNTRNNIEETKRKTKQRNDRTCRPYNFKKGH
ncbi:hypothetical protein ANTPLA_LOCUS7678 [Anthophora plagiata]